MKGIKAVIFDIDGTLTADTSWTYLTGRLGVVVEEHLRIFKAGQEKELGEDQSRSELLALWQSSGKATKREFEKIFLSITLRRKAREVVDYLHEKYTLCLITGSMDLYAEIIAKKLNVKNYYANATLIWNDKEELVDFHYDFNQEQKKLRQFKDFCVDKDLRAEECVIVGDSGNDIELFRVTGRGVAVRTEYEEKELEKFAWRKIDSLEELRIFL